MTAADVKNLGRRAGKRHRKNLEGSFMRLSANMMREDYNAIQASARNAASGSEDTIDLTKRRKKK
jgi:hypothetical protein